MKLAEALVVRGDLQKKFASLRERVSQYATVQQGDKPHQDPEKLLLEAVGVLDELESLVFRINQANLKHKLKDGRTLTEALAVRDMLIQRHALLTAAIAGSTRKPDRYGMSEIKWVAVMDVSKLQKQADDLSKKIREINLQIQETNWRVSIMD